MYLVARLLIPESVGMASLALSIGGLLIIFPPLVMGDVLIARRRYGFSTISNGGAIAVKFSLVTTGCIVALAAPIASVYHNYPTAPLVWLRAFIALRPIFDGLAVTSLTELRVSFQYRTVALVDGGVQLGSTILTVVLASVGFGGNVNGTSTSCRRDCTQRLLPIRRRDEKSAAPNRSGHAPVTPDA
jgi:hypothetical protein